MHAVILLLLPACGAGGNPALPAAVDSTPTRIRIASGPDRIEPNSEEYREYAATMPRGGHVVRFEPEEDGVVLHHLILMRDEPAPGPDGRPVYPTIFAAGRGTGPLQMPEGVGLGIAEGGVVRLGLHLVNATDAPRAFDLGVSLEVRGEVDEEADVLTVGPSDFEIPADGEEHVVSQTCDAPGDRRFFAAYPHMHAIGARIEIDVSGQAVAAVDPWDFADQPLLEFGAIARDGSFGVTCTFVNAGADPVRFGHSSADEMCLAFVFYSPAGLPRTWGCPGVD